MGLQTELVVSVALCCSTQRLGYESGVLAGVDGGFTCLNLNLNFFFHPNSEHQMPRARAMYASEHYSSGR